MFKRVLIFTLSFFAMLVLVACGETTTSVTTMSDTTTTEITSVTTNVELPDLSGYSKDEIITALDDLNIDYDIQYTTNTEIEKDYFVSYGGGDQAGDIYNDNHPVVVYIATPKLILPDMAGLGQSEMISTLLAAGIDFTIEIITDNDVPDQTFAGYGDGLEPGDLIPSTFKVTVYLGYNAQTIPNLTGMLKDQIIKVLDEDNIAYEFNYVINDNYAEDLFAGYQDYEVGDFYSGDTVVIDLYKNTFTDDATSLIISKYLDGGDDTSDQAIEIYNPTDSAVDLSNYHLAIYINGSYTVTYSIPFDDVSLASGNTYLIANTNANSDILSHADLVSDDLLFDGNDTIQLCYSNGTYIDSIYNIGNKNYVMDNLLFIRDGSVVKGERVYAYNEWHGYVPDYTEVLGTFPVPYSYEVPFEFINLPFDEGGMDNVTLYGSHTVDGDTAYFEPGFLNDKRVRFLGVDTPETYPTEDPWGPEAKAYTDFMLLHAVDIYIQSDPDVGYWGNYGRSLGLVWINLGDPGVTYDILSSTGEVMRTETLSGWVLLNYHLVLNGYSYNYYTQDTTLQMGHRYIYSWFQDAERYATENGLGIHE